MKSRIRTWLIVGLLGLQAITVLTVVLLTRANSRAALSEQMDQALVQASDSATERTERFLQPATFAAQLTAGLIGEDVVASSDEAFLEGSFVEQLRLHDQLDGLYLGYPDGSFVYVNRDNERTEDGYRTKVIGVDGGNRQTTLTWYDADGRPVASEPDPADDYDPRTRPWYEDALAADGSIWTEPYVFFTAQEPGVTTATPVATGGDVVGVSGADVSLETLSAFMGLIDVSEDGTAFIVDRDGTMVAHPDLTQVMRGEGEEAATVSIHDVDDPLLEASFDAVDLENTPDPAGVGDDEHPDALEADFSYDGDSYRTRFSPVPSHDDWYIGVVAPESDFIGTIVENQQLNALIALGVSLAVVVLAFPAVWLIARWVSRLSDRAVTDHLTGLVNRGGFDDAVSKAVAEPEGPVAAAVVDVDFFKQINDTYGHAVGDEALKTVADRLRHGVRDGDIVARPGGDEFAVLLLGADSAEAYLVMERIREGLDRSKVHTNGGDIDVHITVGVAAHTEGTSAEDLLEAADNALYEAKRNGRNQVVSLDETAPTP